MEQLIQQARANLAKQGYVVAANWRVADEVGRVWRRMGRPTIEWSVVL